MKGREGGGGGVYSEGWGAPPPPRGLTATWGPRAGVSSPAGRGEGSCDKHSRVARVHTHIASAAAFGEAHSPPRPNDSEGWGRRHGACKAAETYSKASNFKGGGSAAERCHDAACRCHGQRRERLHADYFMARMVVPSRSLSPPSPPAQAMRRSGVCRGVCWVGRGLRLRWSPAFLPAR
jgi:hypothetical protein